MKVPNKYRVRTGSMGSNDRFGNNGCFKVPYRSFEFNIVASDGEGWEHVSISLPKRVPNYDEMCYFKNLFWGEDEYVVQFHPPKSEYINNHPYCLHLWKPTKEKLPVPPAILVGLKELNL